MSVRDRSMQRTTFHVVARLAGPERARPSCCSQLCRRMELYVAKRDLQLQPRVRSEGQRQPARGLPQYSVRATPMTTASQARRALEPEPSSVIASAIAIPQAENADWRAKAAEKRFPL